MTIETRHPAYGKISIFQTNGMKNLFGVDYPQQHFITIRVHSAVLSRELSYDRTHTEGPPIVELSMTEVQFARLISSIGTEGVPCTIDLHRDGKIVRPERIPDQEPKATEYVQEIKDAATKAAGFLNEAMDLVESLLDGKTKLNKKEIHSVGMSINRAQRQLHETVPFVVKQAQEAVETAVEAGKAEVDAHVQFALGKLGERVVLQEKRDLLLVEQDDQ